MQLVAFHVAWIKNGLAYKQNLLVGLQSTINKHGVLHYPCTKQFNSAPIIVRMIVKILKTIIIIIIIIMMMTTSHMKQKYRN